eukprot:2714073-Alexandrium_andersonii.AAC.1
MLPSVSTQWPGALVFMHVPTTPTQYVHRVYALPMPVLVLAGACVSRLSCVLVRVAVRACVHSEMHVS